MPRRTFPLVVLGCSLLAFPAQGALEHFVRPDFQNLTGPGSVSGRDPNPGLIPMQGLVKPAAAAPSDGAQRLTEASFGQPFSPFEFQKNLASFSYAEQVVKSVRQHLYPPRDATLNEIEQGTVEFGKAAFRYKWLLFSPTEGQTDVTSHFESIDEWFNDDDRAAADAQILVLRDALAVNPLSTLLRDALLEIYYDLAVAEMQGAKKKLAALSAKRLALELEGPFVIDDEIATYEELVALEASVLAKYAELLGLEMEGVEPADFDDREQPGRTMGLYTFIRQQPRRNATASEYIDRTTDEIKYIPDYDPETQGPIERDPSIPANLVLFSGYKDYVTLLTIMGQYAHHNAELARLRGMRQSPNDLTLARLAISEIQGKRFTDFQLLRGLFPEVEANENDSSGVRAAITGMETALAEMTNVRSFINGTTNLLGLDPNFLLLVQGQVLENEVFKPESFDYLYELLRGDNQPLGDALNKQSVAEARYFQFQASVDQVLTELLEVDFNYASRFVEITGYAPDEEPGFTGQPKPGTGAELEVIEQSIASITQRNETLRALNLKIQENLAQAQSQVTLARGLDQKLDVAETQYLNRAGRAYEDMLIANSVAAGTQAVADTANAISSAATVFNAAVVGVATAANGAAQIAATAVAGERTRDLDFAAVAFSSAQQRADNALTVNQSLQNLAAIQREQHAIILETTDNTLALTQAQAQRNALLHELKRIEAARDRFNESTRTSYYADPIHYVRSESALILADAAFDNAQRWLFYTQRAAEYKWQQRFSRSDGVRNYDSASVFKLRNAMELDQLLTQIKAWNDDRQAQNIPNEQLTIISMRNDLLAPNPNLLNQTLSQRADPGVRYLGANQIVTQEVFFQRKLAERLDAAGGRLTIDFDTTNLRNLEASFFVGPDYSGATIAPGKWRDKITSVKVNIVHVDPAKTIQDIRGSLQYGGQTFFRTRIPPCQDYYTNPPATNSPGANSLDIPGEFVTAPFRFYRSDNYDNVWVAQDFQITSITAAFMGLSAKGPAGGEILEDENFKNTAFAQRSVATTRWQLALTHPDIGWDVSQIKDIEIIIAHESSDRLPPLCD